MSTDTTLICRDLRAAISLTLLTAVRGTPLPIYKTD
jgi:hypothetical protein